MKHYTFKWKDGMIDEIDAESVSMAFTLLGYSQGALAALDSYTEDDIDSTSNMNKEEKENG